MEVNLTVTVSAVGDVGNVVLATVGVDGSSMVASASGGLITFITRWAAVNIPFVPR